jgi:HSP20 family molecular chaperone IbpA
MAAMGAVGFGHQLPAHANVREQPDEYIVELDVADFTEAELSVETLGRKVNIRGDQLVSPEDVGKPFRLHARLEESFRFPDDTAPEQITVFYSHGTLEIHAPRTRLEWRQLAIEHPLPRVHPNAEPC